MKVLVTGGTGFIGSWVVEELKQMGHTPVVLDHHNRNHQTDVETFYGDVRDDIAVVEAVAHVDAVIHLAAVLGTQETIANPRPAAHTNLLGALNVFTAVHQYEVPAVYIAVGNHWMNNTYSISKTAAERFAFMFNKELDTKIAVVRALNAYGPGQAATPPWGESKVRKIMPAFVCRALADEPIEIYGSGDQVMDMIYVQDVARTLIAGLGAPRHDVVYEAGSGNATTVNDVADVVIDIVGSGSKVYAPMRPGEPDHSVVLGDPSTLTPLGIDISAFTPLDVGVSNTVDYFRQEHFG